MKKLSFLLLAFALVACSSGGSNEVEKTGSAETAKDEKGNYATAEVTIKGDKIVSISLDEYKEGKSKKELGASYNMKAASSIGKEWNEQIEALEKYIVKNGIDKIELTDEGKPKNEDVLTGCTMAIDNVLLAAKGAIEAAKK